MSAYCMFDL